MFKNYNRANFIFKYTVLTCFIIMLAFSVLNISRVLAGVEKINITNAVISDKSSATEASITSFDNNRVVTDVKYHSVNEYVEYTVTIKNNDSKKYTIKTITDNNTDPYIEYTYDKHENEVLDAGTKKDIAVKATYKTEVTNINQRTANDDTEIKITFIEEDGSESDTVIIINPTTGDNLWIYVTLGVLSLSGLLFTLKFKKINKSLLILLLMTPFIAKAASLTYEFKFISEIGYYDKLVVTVDRNGTEETIVVPYGTKITEPTITNIPGYNFVGYFVNGNPVNFNDDITEDTTIEARYSIITYNITYDLAGGTPTGNNPTTYTVDDEFTLSNPTLVGYNFSGWTGTNLSGLTPTVTINKGTINDLSFTANFSAATNTKYTVYHRYQQVTGDLYDTVEENGTGTTGTTIYPQIKPETGFIDPTVQALEILPDGTASIDYVYNRVPCNYEANSNTNSSLANGTYRYGTEITVSPKDVQGYTFTTWEDGSSDNPRTITLTGNTSVTPSYSPNTNTPYTVTHRYQKVTLDGYDEEYVTGHGTTGTTITAPMQTRPGFTTPASTTVEIKGDGTGSATYTYDRLMFNFSVTDRTYLTPESDANSSYPYGKQISVTAVERPGYDFEWLDGETSYTRNITIDSNIELTPVYTAKTDTPYTVKHYKMDVNGTSYTIADTVPGAGTTDSSITPATNTYEGFTAPATQTTTISGTGNTVVEYYYTRNQYNLTIINSQFVEQDKSGPHYYGEQVTLTAINREGYHFVGWSTGGGASTVIITIPVGGITTEPLYSASTDTTYSVKHRYRKLTVAEEYDEVTIGGTGTTGDVIPAPLNPRTGFVNPSVQNITITPDGNAQVIYTYQRDQYAFTITDRTYLDSTSTANGTYPYETPITLKATAREGYTFKWSDNVTDLERSFNLTSAVTLSLDYTANTYNVHFDKNDSLATGTMVDQEFEYDTPENLDSNLFVKTGYTFSGWNTQADGLGTTYANAVEVTNLATSGTVNLYAMWTPDTNTAYKVIHKKQKVTLDGYDEIVENLTGTSDTSVTPSVNNYTGFTTPTAQTVTISRLGDTVVTYVYDREIYTISFNTDGGSTVAAQQLPYGAKVTKPADPTKANYTFDDWYVENNYQTPYNFDNMTVSGTATIYGKFDINTYTVTFNTDGGSTEPAQVIAHGGTVTRPSTDPTKTGYNFINWYTDNTYQTPYDFTNTTITGPITIYAKFEIKTFTVSFDTDGGSSVASQTISYGGTVTRPSNDPTKTGHTFDDWYTDNTYQTPFDFTNTTITDTTTIYGKFDINEYTVTFNTDGGSTEPAQVIAHGGTVTRPSTDPTKTGYNFINWYADSNYQTLFDFTNTTITGPITIYAKFEIKTFTVSFDTDGGSSVPSQTINYGGTVTRPNTDPTKTGHTFDDWYTDSTYQTLFDFANTTITDTTTIYGKFISQTITVTFDVDGGESVSPITITRGQSISSLPTTTKEDYRFEGWYLDLSDPNPVSEPFTPTADVELKAKWQKMICKKATTLTSVECHSNNNIGCKKEGYADGDIVTFGNIVSSDTYSSGDALLCDVDGTGYNKRFYYMRTLNGNAVLIHDQLLVLENDAPGTNYIYDTAKTILPDVTTWTTLPVKFENDTKAARFPTMDDTKAAAGISNVTNTNALAGFNYLFENTGKYATTSGFDTVWLNEVINGGTTYRYRYHNNNMSVSQVSSENNNTSKNCVKPVIEVPLDLIEDDYVVGFNPRGGTVTTGYIRVKKGTAIGTLPTATKSGYVFDGWYTSSQYTTSINENTVPNDYDIYYAKWLLDISNAVIPDVSFLLGVGVEDDIEITSLDVEPVTYASSDNTVVTVDSNGHMVAIDEGTTTIIITGTRTGHVRTINVRVATVLSNYIVSFDTLGGSAVGDMTVPANTALGSLPSPDPTLTDYIFGGWYTDTTYATEVTVNTVIRGDVTFIAKWIPANAVAELNNNQFYTTIQGAVHDAPASGQSTIKVLQDVTVTSGMVVNMYTTDVDKDIILDLNNHTIKATNNYAVRSKGNLIIKDGTIQCTTGKGAVESNTGTLILDNVRVEASGNRQALYIENKPEESGSVTSTLGPPEVEIRGNSYLQAKAASPRGTVQLVSGTLRITSGTIVATTAPALYVTGGTAIVGTQDGAYDNTIPVLKGNTYGIAGTAAIYDGIIMGKSAAVEDENQISGYETGSVKVNGNDGTYYTLYYQMP